MYVYIDPEADYGRGEVMYKNVDPFRVYVDPASRDRFFADASGIILSTFLTKQQLLDTYSELEEIIDDIEVGTNSLHGEDYPTSALKNSNNIITPSEAKNLDYQLNQKYQVLDRFYKVKVPFYRVFNTLDGSEKILNEEFYTAAVEDPASREAFTSGAVEVEEVMQTRIKQCSSVGDVLLFERVLNTDIYPIIPFTNIWTNTPYPKSDVNKVKDSQRLLNKLFSLTLSHAQSAAGLKLLIPEGSVDSVSQLEKDWANPNAVIEYNPEMGESRGKSKLRDIEMALANVGQVIYNMSKDHYKFKKTFRIVQPNNDLTEFTVNSRLYDDKTNELMTIQNDISLGQHDIRIISGSTLPSNKVAEYNMYLDAYKLGLVDDVEVLKKSEIFDKEGVLQRKSQVSQMQKYIAQLENQVKKLSGDLQTAERETVGARKRVETEKFKTQLNEVLQDAKSKQKGKQMDLEFFAKRLGESVDEEDKLKQQKQIPGSES